MRVTLSAVYLYCKLSELCFRYSLPSTWTRKHHIQLPVCRQSFSDDSLHPPTVNEFLAAALAI